MSRVNPEQPAEQQEEQSFNTEGGGEQPGSGSWILDGPDDGVQFEGEEPVAQQPQLGQPAITQPSPTQAQPGGQFEVRLKTGQVFRGATFEDAANAAQAHLDRLTTQAANPQPTTYQGRQQQTTQPQYRDPAPAPAEWNDETFFATLAKNPRGAMDMWAQHYFGVENPADALSTSYDVSVQVSDRIAIADFLSTNQDFPASPESGALLVKRLEADGADLTTWNLEVAYRQLVREGVLAPVTQQAQQPPVQQQPQYEQGRQQAQPRGSNAPRVPVSQQQSQPNTDGELGSRELTIDQFEQLTAPQMRQYMAARRGQGRR